MNRPAAEARDGWTVARMAASFTPGQCASIKARVIGLHLATMPDARADSLLRADAGHQWFVYCLGAVARRA